MKKTLAQRAIIYSAVVGGLTEDQCNQILASANYPKINSSSWKMMQRKYLPAFKNDLNLMGECIFKPRAMKDLPEPTETVSEVVADTVKEDADVVTVSDVTPAPEAKKSWWSRLFG